MLASLSEERPAETRRPRTLRASLVFLAAALGVGSAFGASASAQTTCGTIVNSEESQVYGGSWGGQGSAQAGDVLLCNTVQQKDFWTATGKTPSSYVQRLKRAIQVRFVTTDAANRKVPATAMLLVPSSVPEANKGQAPVIAIASGTVGVADRCAPSLTIRNGEGLTGGFADYYLSKGLTVLIVDYIGLGTQLSARDGDDHPYLEGESAAHVMLDALRAARKVPGGAFFSETATIPQSWPVAVTGYSQGGSASLWATLRKAEYANELPLKASLVGAPMVDGKATLEWVDNSIFRSLNVYALYGLKNATDPQVAGLDVESLLSVKGKALWDKARGMCATDVGVSTALDVLMGGLRLRDLLKDHASFMKLQKVQDFLVRNSVIANGQVRLPAPTTPTLGYHGMIDEVTPYGAHRELMTQRWGASWGNNLLFSGYVSAARQPLVFQPVVGEHASSTSAERGDADADRRYTPYEWTYDSLFGYIRSEPDLTPSPIVPQ